MKRRTHPSLIVMMSIALISLITFFTLSAGPIFAYHCRFADARTASICRVYHPLFRIAPSLTGQYLNGQLSVIGGHSRRGRASDSQ